MENIFLKVCLVIEIKLSKWYLKKNHPGNSGMRIPGWENIKPRDRRNSEDWEKEMSEKRTDLRLNQ